MKRLVLAATVIAASILLITATATPSAYAAPTLTVGASSPATVLIDAPSTPVTVSVSVANPTTTTNGYNLGYRAVLPAGVSFGGTSSLGTPEQYPQVDGTTVLWWENVSDILAASSSSLTFSVLAANATFPVNSTVTIPVAAYTHSDPRTIPTVDADGAIVALSQSGTGAASAMSRITAIDIEKSEPSPEAELLRGIHDHETVYTLTITGNGANPDNAVVVDDYLDAGLEFLGCGAWDNTTDAPTNLGSTEEYPGSGSIDATVDPDLAAGAPDHCLQPVLVETVSVDPDGAGPLPTDVYTHVQWSLGTLAVDEVRTIQYYAGVPILENTLSWSGATPATACTITDCDQAANLDNNSGAETIDEQQLPNHAIAAGVYTGPVAPTTSTTATDETTVVVAAEDLRMQKGADQSVIDRNGLTDWTITIATGEYRRVDGPVTVIDTLPDGLCPLGGSNFTSGNEPSDAECDPVGGRTPSLPYAVPPVENADGTWTITWVIGTPSFTTSDTLQITFPTRARTSYQQGFADTTPVLANDGWTNTVAIPTVDAQHDVLVAGLPLVNPANDDSSASQASPNPGIEKDVAVPPATGTLNCNSAVWIDADDDASAAGYYRPGDRVCYRVQLVLEDTGAPVPVGTELQYRNVVVADYLPPGMVFEQFWGTNAATGETTGDTIVDVNTLAIENTSAGQLITWELGTDTPDGRFVDAASEPFFEVVFSATLPIASYPTGGLYSHANLVKATTLNTAGAATSLRELATEVTTRPALSLDKSRVPSSATVAPASSITYTVTVRNDAPTESGGTTFGAANDIDVRDVLPFEIDCSDVSTPIPNGGVCTDGVTTGTSPHPVRSVIDWTIAGPLNPQATSAVTYVVNLPSDLAPSEDLTNTAGVRAYDQLVNTGGPDITWVPPTATTVDPTAVPNNSVPALDTETVSITNVTTTKLQQSNITETGNASNASQLATPETVTIGEEIAYTVRASIPAGTTIYDTTTAPFVGFRDTLPSGFRILPSPAPTATLNGGALPVGWTFDSGTLTVVPVTPYLNATGSGADVIEMTFTVVVEDVVANVNGAGRDNTATFRFGTKQTSMGVTAQNRTITSAVRADVVEPAPTIVKTENDADDFVVPGQTITYSLTAGNTGTSPAHDTVITDCVPFDLVVQTPVAPPVSPVGVVVTTSTVAPSCGGGGTLITWTYPAGHVTDPAGSVAVTYDVVVNDPLVASSSLRNTAEVTFSSVEGTDPDEREYTASTDHDVFVGLPTLTKTHAPDPVTIGETATYTLQVVIPQDVVLYDSVVHDDMPAGLSFEGLQSVNCAPAACPAVTVLGATAPQNGPTVGYWMGDIGPYAADQTITITYAATVLDTPANDDGDLFDNTATVRWNRTDSVVGTPGAVPATFDADLPDVTDTLELVEPRILIDKDVAISGCNTTASAPNAGTDDDVCNLAPAGAAVTYTLTIQNTGSSPAHELVIVDDADLPSSAFASLNITNAGGATVVDSSIVDGDGIELHHAGPLAPAGIVTITYSVTLRTSANLAQLQQILNTASVPSYLGVSLAAQAAILADFPARDFRTHTENPADTDTVTLHYPVPGITKTAVSTANDARIGTPFTWQLVVRNTDTVASLIAYDVVDTLPTGWNYVPGSSQVTAVTSGATPAVGAIADPAVAGQALTWGNLGTLPPGATATIRFQATPQASLGTVGTTGTFDHVNTATLTGDDATGATGNLGGPYTATDTEPARIRRVDLTLDKSITPAAGPYALGQEVDYTITVQNQGPDAATDFVVADVLPVGLTYRSTTSISQGSLNTGTLDWTVGALANGGTATLVVRVELNATGVQTNVAEIETADQHDDDSTPGNSSTTEDDDDTVSISVVPTSLGDQVWLDLDADGTQDVGEPGIPNVTVELRDAGPDNAFGTLDDGPTLTDVTDATGIYGFGGLRIDRTYRVSVLTGTLPPGLAQTYDLDGLGTANTTDTTVPTTTPNLTVDFGYRGIGSIGDTVWLDADASGGAVQQAGEPGLPRVDLTVTWAGFDATLGTSDDIVFTDTTDAAGTYLVGNLPFGGYLVAVDSGTVPAGLDQTYDLDGIAGLSAHNAAAVLSVANPNELDVDFSYTGTGSIGDRVWLDADSDGVQDAGELGIINVVVDLVWYGVDGVPGGGDDVALSTTTGADGLYLFPNLPPGNYAVTVTPPNGVGATYDLDGALATPDTATLALADGQDRTDVDFGYVGGGSIGDRIWWDTLATGDSTFDTGDDLPLAGVEVTITWAGPDAAFGTGDDRVFTDTTDAAGNYLVTNLPFGGYRVEVDTADLPAGMTATYDLDGLGTPDVAETAIDIVTPDRLDVDFGYTGVGSIGDTVWYDFDGGGESAPELGDQLLAGVDVTVTWFGADDAPGGVDDVVFTTTTDVAGTYVVAGLPHGEYSVVVDPATLPAGLDVATFDLDGTAGASAHNAAATLSAGNPDEFDVDFAYTGAGSIGDTVWLDLDGDGTQDAGEPGIPDVTVTLTFTGPSGAVITVVAVTAADGTYLFAGLPAGSFTVTVDPASLPLGLAPTADLDGIGTPHTTVIALTPGQDRVDADFGYQGIGSIGDEVWLELDTDGDGALDPSDIPLAGVSIDVLFAGLDGVFGNADDVTVTTTTDADGLYLVDGLPLGEYRVMVDTGTLLPGIDPTFDLDGTASPNTADRTLDVVTPDARDVDFSYAGTGSLGDTVWHDRDGDGTIDTGEEPLPAVVVTVVWAGPDGALGTADDVTFTDATDAAGTYLVDTLPGGDYRVSIDPATLPPGYVPTFDVDGGNDRTATVTLAPGQDRTDVDFGEREQADLAISKTHPAGSSIVGDTVTYTISVRNLGPGEARNVSVGDALPVGLVFVSAQGQGWTCTAAGLITCQLATPLASGVTATPITLVAIVDASAPSASLVNVATVTSSTPDPVPTNNRAEDPTAIYRIDLSIDKVLQGELVAGELAQYRLTITNNGPAVAVIGDVVVVDDMPSTLTPTGATGSGFACTITGNRVECLNTTPLAVGEVRLIDLVARVNGSASNLSVTNSATVASAVAGDVVPANNVDAASAVAAVGARLVTTGGDVARLVAAALSLLLVGGALQLASRHRGGNPSCNVGGNGNGNVNGDTAS